ncbi:hypothetical protein FHR90_003258 [Endobacter medicaginis]|uniref:Restriction endonuclease BglII n=1 Tax=Endobacter medicaginis TaxID=1181271 RepID=A0A839V3P6_9PROT|nr:BglII/BstYI family type II restriction endonuclease [Endobacter medicaginis]MBB3175403.1 hypothetical protein [Endobacter medicaginis]MCX5476745.1 BglII/BstYI family type II restriction endonuclease [Endobacter medicaginis]NVN29351.1 hypothetical protein [Endobacter medicaginis]
MDEFLSGFELLSAVDVHDSGLLPDGFTDKFDVYSYRNALRILSTSCRAEFEEVIEALEGFSIRTDDIVVGGGNKSKIAKGVEGIFHPLGWRETRVSADLLITRTVHIDPNKRGKSAPTEKTHALIKNAVDGHKIDFVKGRVAFDMEWNSKDQTFDRDLYAMRSFYETNIISAGILLTRGESLVPVFSELKARAPDRIKTSKFGASTTWMRKLTPRLDAGRAGGCPILALGIRPALITDYEQWLDEHPRQQEATSILSDEGDADDED